MSIEPKNLIFQIIFILTNHLLWRDSMYKNNLWITAFALSSLFIASSFAKQEKIQEHKNKLLSKDQINELVSKRHKRHHRRCEQKCLGVKICAKDINGTGFVISKSGEYYLCEDVIYNPQGLNPAITISSAAVGNVTLDLNGKTLSQANKTILGIAGVAVGEGLTNIIIKDGTIRDFSLAGIFVGSATNTTPTLATELDFSGIRAFNNGSQDLSLNALLTGMGGLVIWNAEDIAIHDSDFNTNQAAGLFGINIIKMTVDSSHFDDNVWANFSSTSTLPSAFGVNLTPGNVVPTATIDDVLFTRCTFNRNTSVGGTVSGISGRNTTLESCEANENGIVISNPAFSLPTNPAPSVFGINFASFFSINDCQINGTSLIVNTQIINVFNPARVTQAIGIHFGNNGSITNTVVSGGILQNNSVVGLRLQCQSISGFNSTGPVYIGNCQTIGNTISTTQLTPPINLQVVEGIDCANVAKLLIEDCLSAGHTQAAINPHVTGAATSIASGFNVHFSTGQLQFNGPIVLRRCVALNNTDTTPVSAGNGGTASGFCTRQSTTPIAVTHPIVFESCIAESNTNNAAGTAANPFGAGFDLLDIKNSKIINCYAEENQVGIRVTETIPGTSGNNIFTGNILSANTQFGINDLTAATLLFNAYYSNQAKNNGATPATTNYAGAIFPPASCLAAPANTTPILFWQLPLAPCSLNTNGVPPTNLDNLSIVN